MSRIALTEFECELACESARSAINALVKVCELTGLAPAEAAKIILDDTGFKETVRREIEAALKAIVAEKGRPS